MEENNKKVESKSKTLTKAQKQKYTKLFIALTVLVVVVICIVIFVSKGNKEKETQKNGDVNTTQQTEGIGEVPTGTKKGARKISDIKAQPLDKSNLEKLINNAETVQTSAYTQESVDALNAAVEEGKAVLESEEEQSKIEGACKKIVDAMQNLKEQ